MMSSLQHACMQMYMLQAISPFNKMACTHVVLLVTGPAADLGVAKVADLQQRPLAVVQQRVLQLLCPGWPRPAIMSAICTVRKLYCILQLYVPLCDALSPARALERLAACLDAVKVPILACAGESSLMHVRRQADQAWKQVPVKHILPCQG